MGIRLPKPLGLSLGTLLGILGVSGAQAQVRDQAVSLPTWSEQIGIREGWLTKRHGLLLDMMRRHNVAMWIVVNEEFHNDPIVEYVAPPRPYAGNRDFFIFVDAGSAGLKKFSITGYPEENLKAFFEPMPEGRNPTKMLSQLYAQFSPKTIAIGMDGSRGVTRSVTHATYELVREALGAEGAGRLTSAADLIEEYLDTRLPEERETYTKLVRITDQITRQALSDAVIKPGKTTVGDVRRWLYDELGRRGVSTWFQPDLRVQRRGGNATEVGKHSTTPAAPGPALEGTVIGPGDVVHLDFGISFMGLHTDWQKMAYVLRPGETDVAPGLKAAMANTNALQDAVMLTCSRPGRMNSEAADCAMKEMEKRATQAQIYSHPIGNQGHGLGAGINSGGPAGRPGKPLRNGSYISIELNTATKVPEWEGQNVFVMMEDDAYLTDQGWKFFWPRQEAWYLIK